MNYHTDFTGNSRRMHSTSTTQTPNEETLLMTTTKLSKLDTKMDFWIKNGLNVLLEGQQGVGKSTIIDADSCNFCNNYKYDNDLRAIRYNYHEVYVLAHDSGNGLTVNICEKCLAQLDLERI